MRETTYLQLSSMLWTPEMGIIMSLKLLSQALGPGMWCVYVALEISRSFGTLHRSSDSSPWLLCRLHRSGKRSTFALKLSSSP